MRDSRIFSPSAVGNSRVVLGGRSIRGKGAGAVLLQSGLGGMGSSATTSSQGFGLKDRLKNLKVKRGNIKISF